MAPPRYMCVSSATAGGPATRRSETCAMRFAAGRVLDRGWLVVELNETVAMARQGAQRFVNGGSHSAFMSRSSWIASAAESHVIQATTQLTMKARTAASCSASNRTPLL